jgi:hypothetical protein
MPAPDNVSYLSRFLLKFAEIIAAGLATAVSGYLIAHLSGVLSSPAPGPAAAVIQVAPNAGMVSNSPVQSIAPDATTLASPAIGSLSTRTNDQRLAPQRELNAPPVTQPGRKTANVTKPEPARKRIDNAASTAANPRDEESFVSQVRAALTSVDANRTEPPEPFPHQGDHSRSPGGIAKPVINPPSAAVVAAPAPPDAPIEPNSAMPAEIKSRPIVETQTPADSVDKNTGGLTALEQMLRQDPLAGTEEAPRPPLPVGQ